MEKIRLELADWLYNAGIVGMANILGEGNYEVGKNYIEFDRKELEGFQNKYFGYFIKKYEKFTTCYKILNTNFDIKNIIKSEQLEALNKQIEYIKTKIKSNSYQSVYKFLENETLLEYEKQLKKITKRKMKK